MVDETVAGYEWFMVLGWRSVCLCFVTGLERRHQVPSRQNADGK
jgi:hypothetical protein